MMRANLLLPIAILIAAAMLCGSLIWSTHEVLNGVGQAYQAQLAYQNQLAQYQQQLAQAQAQAAAQPGQAPAPPVDSSKVQTAGEPFIGSPNAPLTMAYWFDYQCPFCQRVEEMVMPDLIANYVKPGMMKIVFKDYVFLGPDSQTAALAARAVWEIAPDKFYDWHKAVFDHQDQENAGWGSQADIIALTRTIPGIDADKVAELMMTKANDYNTALQNDGYEGSTMGVSGTPGAIIGKQLIVGAQPYAQFKSAIDTALAASAESTPAGATTDTAPAAAPAPATPPAPATGPQP